VPLDGAPSTGSAFSDADIFRAERVLGAPAKDFGLRAMQCPASVPESMGQCNSGERDLSRFSVIRERSVGHSKPYSMRKLKRRERRASLPLDFARNFVTLKS